MQGREIKNTILFVAGLSIFAFHYCIDFRSHSVSPRDEPHHLLWKDRELKFQPGVSHNLTKSKLPARIAPLFFQPIPINDAGLDLLVTVPGIGPQLGKEILKARSLNGSFTRAEDLLLVKGVGRKRMGKFSHYLSFD